MRTFRRAGVADVAGRDRFSPELRRRAALTVGLATVLAGALHVLDLVTGDGGTAAGGQVLTGLVDWMLCLPVLAVAVAAADRLVPGTAGDRSAAVRAAALSLCGLVALVPLAEVRPLVHQIVLGAVGPAPGTAGLAGVLRRVVVVQPVLFAAAYLLISRLSAQRGRQRHRWVGLRRRLALASAVLLPAAMVVTPPSIVDKVPLVGARPAVAGTGGCAAAPTVTFDVSAINVDLTIDRFGDHDPFAFMYTLAGREHDVRAQEAALQAAAKDPNGATAGAKVSTGLGADPIQPLVLRATLGTCVVINLTNKLTAPPRGGPGLSTTPVITQAGGIPSVSIDMQGVSYDAAGGANGEAAGNNPGSVMVPPGGTHTYRFYLDPLLGEGARVFRSGGESTQLTAHGLFGALVAEPAWSRWYDARTGQDMTDNATFSSWDAMVAPGSGPAFREFTIMYHEIGDENFNLRRPPREDGQPHVPADPDGLGAPLPMVDDQPISNGGSDTRSYRPGGRALNYRSEPFFRRLNLLGQRGQTDALLQANESLAYGSYMFGDPATPMPRSYLGEPTKTRLVHPGFEQLHVHHLHGGGDRWRMNPNADDTDIDGGLEKTPIQHAKSIRLDSQTLGPSESFNLEHECGAGGCQQAAGDFLYHCHIAHHYIAGMWGFWRVYNTSQPDIATLPGRTAAPAGVTAAGLLGRTIEGRTVVPRADLADPGTQVALEDLVESQLPPPGARLSDQDATVWDWARSGTASAPDYLGEPEDTTVWPDYTSANPGQRPEILFDPRNGRPAWPLLRPHLGKRPPFSPNGHSGTPYLGSTASANRPDGLCPSRAPVRTYNVTAISVPIKETVRETDQNGEIYVLNEDKGAVLAGTRPADPLVIRSNVGDCVAITLSNELNPAIQQKVNMHTHFVQFDPQASDGVITGFSYEQSVYADNQENRTVTADVAAGASTVPVSDTNRLRVGISIGIGVGRTDIEVRKITALDAGTVTVDQPLGQAHAPGEPATVEFVQYRWYSDVDSGTVFWHDHVNGIQSWAHGLFGAHIIEPAGATYHDPVTGAAIRSGTMADIHTSGSVGAGQNGSFREFMVFLGNGRRGRPELTNPAFFGILGMNRDFGQECEEGSINLRAAPVGERVPPGSTPNDPATTDQRQEFDGQVCRSTTSNVNDGTGGNTVNATVATVDPYVFSSVKYGDPVTPLFRAYAGDPVVIRTLGIDDRDEALRIQGHRFRMERFSDDGELTDTATTGISERFDYVLDGGAGGPARLSGDYLYYSTRNNSFETGAWGIFRVYDHARGDLEVLPGRNSPPDGAGFPLLSPTTGNTQQNPGPNPPPASQSGVVSNSADPCPGSADTRAYDVSVFNQTLPSQFPDTKGVMYALTSDVAAIKAGTRKPEPLVLRVDQSECLQVTLHNEVSAGSLYGGTRAGFDLSKLLGNPQTSGGGAVGLNPDTTVPIGGSTTYRFYADKSLGTNVFRNIGSEDSQRHGAYGMVIVEPSGSTWSDSSTNAAFNATRTGTQAIIRLPDGTGFREFALTLQTSDQHLGRSIVPYQDVVAGAGLNSTFSAGNPAVADKGFTTVNYQSEPLTVRLGLTTAPPKPSPDYSNPFSSAVYGDPKTPVVRAYAGDPVIFRVAVGASEQFHSFMVAGHEFPREPGMWNGTTDRRSALAVARSVGAGETLNVVLVGGAGGPQAQPGDYLYRDARQQFTAAGMWGIFRVVPGDTTLEDLSPL
ncbi:MAG TPA: hypothetical protein VJT31_26515 [Rugosimonospora sp.]|nr:hypothetical protein [Rugosimonospora sp.]